MKLFLPLILSAVVLANTNSASAQSRQDSIRKQQERASNVLALKQKHHNFYKRTLNIDSAKAEKVLQIQDSYKSGMKAAISDSSLSLENRRAKIKALMEEKNRKLAGILTPGQLDRIIPSTERRSVSAEKKN